jgi:hypothetical protein
MQRRARSGAAGGDAATLACAASAPSGLEALPDVLLVQILLLLPMDQRLRAQLVSKRLRALVAKPASGLWQRVSFHGACARRAAARGAQPLRSGADAACTRRTAQACPRVCA